MRFIALPDMYTGRAPRTSQDLSAVAERLRTLHAGDSLSILALIPRKSVRSDASSAPIIRQGCFSTSPEAPLDGTATCAFGLVPPLVLIDTAAACAAATLPARLSY